MKEEKFVKIFYKIISDHFGYFEVICKIDTDLEKTIPLKNFHFISLSNIHDFLKEYNTIKNMFNHIYGNNFFNSHLGKDFSDFEKNLYTEEEMLMHLTENGFINL